jgi:hypothetical protein
LAEGDIMMTWRRERRDVRERETHERGREQTSRARIR